jgi:hypothetical protein
MSSVGFEPAIPATKRLHTYSLDRVATGIGMYVYKYIIYKFIDTTNKLVCWFVLRVRDYFY